MKPASGTILLLVLLMFAGPAAADLVIVDGDQTLLEGSVMTFTVATMDGDAYLGIIPNSEILWTSSDTQVGSVFSGTFGAADGGETRVTAEYAGMTASVVVTVVPQEETMDLLQITPTDAMIPNGTYMLFSISGFNETYGTEIFFTEEDYDKLTTDGSDIGEWWLADDPDMPVMFSATSAGTDTTTLFYEELQVAVNITVEEPVWDVIWTEPEMSVDEYSVFSVPAVMGNLSSGFSADDLLLNWTTGDTRMLEVLDAVNGTFRARTAGEATVTVASEMDGLSEDVPVHIREVVLPTPIPEPTQSPEPTSSTPTSGNEADGSAESGSISPEGSVSFGTASGVQSVAVPEGMTGTITLKKDSTAPAPSGDYYTMMDISSSTPLTGTATIRFGVPLGILELEGLTSADVAMLHYENNNWIQLPTRYVGEDHGLAEYSTETGSLSPFAIAFVPGGATENAVTLVPTATATLKPTDLPTAVPTASAVPDAVIVQFAENVSADRQEVVIAELKNLSGATAVREKELAETLVPGLVLVRLPEGVTPDEAIIFYAGFPEVMYAEKDQIITIDSATVTPTETQATTQPEETKTAVPLAGLAAGFAVAALLRQRR